MPLGILRAVEPNFLQQEIGTPELGRKFIVATLFPAGFLESEEFILPVFGPKEGFFSFSF